PSFTPPLGHVFTIIDNDGSEPVIGIFRVNTRALPNGSLITNSGTIYRISYNGGDGNDVTLTSTLGAPSSMIKSSNVGTNGLFTLNGTGFSNAPYFLEAATNLAPSIPWQTISTNTSSSNGVYQFIDLDS